MSSTDPLSLRKRGDAQWILQYLSQERLQSRPRDVAVPDADYAITLGFEEGRPRLVVCPSIGAVMNAALELYDQPFRGTVEVHDETVEDVLAAELQAEDLAIPQQCPAVALGGTGVEAELARQRESLRWGKASQRVHSAMLRPRWREDITKQTHGGSNDRNRSPSSKGRGGQGVRTGERPEGRGGQGVRIGERREGRGGQGVRTRAE